jgi:hypothetical protein
MLSSSQLVVQTVGASLWPLLIALGVSLSAFAGSLGWCTSAAIGDCLPVALVEDDPNRLFTRGVPGGNVKQLFCGLWLITVEFIH